jgi:hypothetical protein
VVTEEVCQVAEEIATEQKGVISVINDLQVEQDETPVVIPLVVPPPIQDQ